MVRLKKSTYEERFITAAERKERLLALLPSKGYDNFHQLAEAMSMDYAHFMRTMKRENNSTLTIKRLAYALDVSVGFLIER